jgi:hypothetical protein
MSEPKKFGIFWQDGMGEWRRSNDFPGVYASRAQACDALTAAGQQHLAYSIRALGPDEAAQNDSVNHPSHYTSHPSGVEQIEISEHMTFCLGNAVKYIWRAGLKSPDAIQDLKKAGWYISREISRLEKQAKP